MKKCTLQVKMALIFFLLPLVSMKISAQNITSTKAEVIEIIKKANDYWQSNNSYQVSPFWDKAAYHTGNMEAYFVTGIEKYRTYSENWAKYNNWKGATSSDKTLWKYTYGEKPEYVLFGDWQICFQTYIDLYNLSPDNQKIERAKEVMEYEMSTAYKGYWWWVDGLYMVMPVMTKLYKLTGNQLYLDKLYEYFVYADSIMYDKDEHLYYRDAKYVYPKSVTTNGLKNFWARGDGWVFAGLAKVLNDLPKNDAHRAFYEERYLGLAKAILKCQQKEGYWTRSLLDPANSPGYETSGTAFFTYGLFWGINNGYLDKATYLPAAILAWDYLSTLALQANGSVGYVQPIGENPSPTQTVSATSTANFGVGAFLLAASELTRTIDIQNATTRIKKNTGKKTSLKVYPVPATDTITIESETALGDLQVVNSKGLILQRLSSQGKRITLNVLPFPAGVYFVNSKEQKIKFVKK